MAMGFAYGPTCGSLTFSDIPLRYDLPTKDFMKRTKAYTPELHEEALNLALAQGLTLEDAAARIANPHRQPEGDF